MNNIEDWWDEQGPKGYDIMQIYASTNTETKDPVIVVELEEALVLYSKIQLSESVAMSTVKAAHSGKVIKPTQVLSTLNSSKLKENKMNKTKMMVKRLKEDTEYQKFFQMAMKKFNINSPAELKDAAKKKEFFDYVDKNYKGKDEMNEAEYVVDYKYMKPFTQDLQQAIRTLQVLNDKIETAGPLSEDIVDALESLEGLYNKIKQAR